MLIASIIIFVFVALLGLLLLTYVLRNKETPKGVAIIHGSFAALGIILLIIYLCLYTPKPYLVLSAFILAALGGFTLMFRDITNRSLPKWLALGHGLIAIIGFILLLVFTFYFRFVERF